MKKEFLILQPPHVNKYRLLIDGITDDASSAITNDLDKVEYNREILSSLGSDLGISLQIQTALTQNFVCGVFPLGRYITIIICSSNEKIQSMQFFDFESPIPYGLLKADFPKSIIKQFEQIHKLLLESFSSDFDLFELFLP